MVGTKGECSHLGSPSVLFLFAHPPVDWLCECSPVAGADTIPCPVSLAERLSKNGTGGLQMELEIKSTLEDRG